MKTTFRWCEYNWKCSMEGGRIIHPAHPWAWYDRDSVFITKDDILEFTLQRKPRTVHYWDGSVYNPVMACGLIRSKEAFGYGTFSAEIMLPKGCNLWPSFWITGTDTWPPEIDIMEAWSDKKGKYFEWFIPQFPYFYPSWKTTTNVHYKNSEEEHKHTGSRNIPFLKQIYDPQENFIEYKCVRTPDSIKFYADNKLVRTVDGDACKLSKGDMNIVFNIWCENPEFNKVTFTSPMRVKNFKYLPLCTQ